MPIFFRRRSIALHIFQKIFSTGSSSFLYISFHLKCESERIYTNERMPVQKKVVENWKFSCLGYETSANNKVTLIYCKTCREYSKLVDVKNNKKGIAKSSETFVKRDVSS